MKIDKLLVTLKTDIVLIQEPVTDGNGVYQLDRLPLRVIATTRRPSAAIVVVYPNIGVLALLQLCTKHIAVATLTIEHFSVTLISSYFQYRIRSLKEPLKGDIKS
jgi:hypothetical protein